MKWFLFGMLVTLYACNSGNKKDVDSKTGNKKIDTAKSDSNKNLNLNPAKETNNNIQEKDTIYKIGKFLVNGPIGIKLGLINNKHPKPFPDLKDTLYDYDNFIIVSNQKGPWVRVYEKHNFHHQFSDYKVDSIYKGELADPDFKTDPQARHYQTRIKNECEEQGVNFAGHYTITEFGCGTFCSTMAIVDRITGKIIYSKIPFDKDDGHCGCDYQTNSSMLIVNTCGLDDYPGYQSIGFVYRWPEVYEFKDGEFKKLE
jgi:hypothetical protein